MTTTQGDEDSLSGSAENKHPRGLSRAVGRPLALVSALTVMLLSIAVACGAGDGESDRDRDDIEVVMSTFTPTVEGATPPANATRDARSTAEASTATYAAENPPPPPPTRDLNATQVVPTVDPEAEESLRPPHAWLSDGSNQWQGVFGNYSFVDLESGSYGNVIAPFYDVGDDGLTIEPGGELEFILQDEAQAPTSMASEPTSVEVEIYTWDENNAIPTGSDGAVGDHPWFVPAVPPVTSSPLDMSSPVFTMPAAPDRYVVRVEVTWPTGNAQENPPQVPIFAVYAFTVYVQ